LPQANHRPLRGGLITLLSIFFGTNLRATGSENAADNRAFTKN